MSLASLIGIDKERYDQGNTFLSQDPYLQNFQGRAPITFNQSAPNVDTMYGGNTSIYGTPTNTGGDSMGATMPTGNFNQKSIGSLIDPYQGQPSFLNNALNKAKDYGLKAFASQMGAQGGAMLGGMILGGILPILLGAGAGGKFGFDMAGATGSDPQGLISNFYGNQGNTPMQYIDEEGNLVDSIMQGYNINSAFGKGMPAAIQARIDRITNRKAPQTIASGKLLAALRREQNAITGYGKDVEKARAINIAAGYGGSDDSAGATGPTASGAGMGVGGGYASDYQGEDSGGSFGSESNDSDFSNYS
mgnify:FL=1